MSFARLYTLGKIEQVVISKPLMKHYLVFRSCNSIDFLEIVKALKKVIVDDVEHIVFLGGW